MKDGGSYPVILSFQDCPDAVTNSLIESECISFDVFDTVLHRKESPEKLNRASCRLFSNILSKYGSNVDWFSVYEKRRTIKKNLKLLSQYQGYDPEYRFDAILEGIGKRFLNSKYELNKEKIRKEFCVAELELEISNLEPAPGIVELLSFLASRNKKVIFISDMYLSSEDVFFILKAFSLDQYFIDGFTSSDYQLTKRSGRIFKEVFNQLKTNTKEVIHIGDHFMSDFLNPRKSGLRSFLYMNPMQRFRSMKHKLNAPVIFKHLPFVHNFLRTQEHRKEIVRNLDVCLYNAAKYTIAPIFLTFVENILRVARSESIDRVYFLSRDGFIFYKYFKSMSEHWQQTDLSKKAQYVFLSRVTTSLACTQDIWKDGLTKEGWKLKSSGMGAFLRGFGITKKDIDFFCKKHGIDTNIKISFTKVLPEYIQSLIDDEAFIKFVAAEKMRQVTYLESYLGQIGFFEASKVLFIDIGWHGTAQNSLQKLFGDRKDYPLVLFEYFGYIGKRSREMEKNGDITEYRKGFYFNSIEWPFNKLTNLHSGGATRIIENCCRPYHGSVITYKKQRDSEHLVPVLGPSFGEMHKESKERIHFFHRFMAGLQDGFDLWIPENWENNEAFVRRSTMSRKMLFRVLSNPEFEDAGAFLSMPYEQNDGLDGIQSLKGFSLKIFSTGNRSVWIPANLTWSGLDVFNPIYNICWINIKRLNRLLSS